MPVIIPVHDATTPSDITYASSSWTFSHTVNAGNASCLVVRFQGVNADTVTGVTYAGTAMTYFTKYNNGSRYAYIYYLANPALGANNVVISASAGNLGGSAFASTYFNVNKFSPMNGASANANTSTTPAVTVASNLDSIVIDCLVTYQVATMTCGQTQDGNRVNSNECTAASRKAGAAGNVTMNWTLNVSKLWVVIAGNLAGFPVGANPVSVTPYMMA